MAATAIEVFFMERFVQLARPGGLIAVIVPDSILSSDQLGPLRLRLLEKMVLRAVVSLPHKVFSGVGANARTGIIFARRFTEAEQRAVQTAKPIGQGCRMPETLLKEKVYMLSPRPEDPGWSLEYYLAKALEIIAAQQPERRRKRAAKL
jgi:type I restriction-modification system DNA methylase subunit